MSLPAILLLSTALGAAALPPPDFGAERVSPEARQVAAWALASGDHGRGHLVIVDKKRARVYVLSPAGRLLGAAPALLGLARGDESVPGIGERPLRSILPHERTTPAGRFVAEPGTNLAGEDIVWVDYASAVSMHRVRATLKSERRLQRLASPTPGDNRISYGCINLPVRFYEQVLVPAVRAGAVVYVLPDTRALAEVFPPGRRPARPSPQAVVEAGSV
ncbi:hypothetical protein ACT80S_02870 [Ramlibacter sp. MAHUQ-53]|uniref:hypothetical protein n=1 Tax=unclassified Ramlibacter TaxID=2617605 RepID=UPI00363B9DBB